MESSYNELLPVSSWCLTRCLPCFEAVVLQLAQAGGDCFSFQ